MAILGLVCVPLVWQNLFWYGWNSEAFIRMMPSKRVLRQAEEDIKSYKQLALNLDCQDNSSYNDPRFKSAARDFLTNSEIVARCSNCSEYFEAINSNGFAQTTTEELETPLAFAYTVHKDIGILEAFLSLYFRPMDAHCIHVDAKADMGIYKTVQSIVRCYNEVFPESLVFISRQSIPVFWGKGGSMMEADIICYRELISRSNKWKYVSNVAGTELPFVSIQRFRQKLRDANGNSIRITRKKFPHRHNHIYEIMR